MERRELSENRVLGIRVRGLGLSLRWDYLGEVAGGRVKCPRGVYGRKLDVLTYVLLVMPLCFCGLAFVLFTLTYVQHLE